MVVTFPPLASQTILDILIDLRDHKPYRVISRDYDVSVHYIKKMNRYFGQCNSSDKISAIRRRINIENHRVKAISVDPQLNYQKYKAYYTKYGRVKNIRLREERLERRKTAQIQLEQEARASENIDEVESIIAGDFEFIPDDIFLQESEGDSESSSDESVEIIISSKEDNIESLVSQHIIHQLTPPPPPPEAMPLRMIEISA